MKKGMSILLTLALVLVMAVPAFAAVPQPDGEVQYTNAQTVRVTMTIDEDGLASVTVRVGGKDGVVKIEAEVSLARKVGGLWVPVASWPYSVSGKTLVKANSYQLTTSGEYRAMAIVTLTGSTVEVITVTDTDSY